MLGFPIESMGFPTFGHLQCLDPELQAELKFQRVSRREDLGGKRYEEKGGKSSAGGARVLDLGHLMAECSGFQGL